MPYFFNSNHTGFCQTSEVISKISNLTASYATAGNGGGQQELMKMVCAPIIMFILIALFLCGTFDVRAVLSPNLRLLLSSALALFLPVMSYLFSEAKDAAGATSEDLSVRARVILTWMLLVELLRKKVDEMRMWGSYSSSIQRAGRVVWLGSLVYFNITSPGRKAVFSILWILCATKLLQRIIFTEVEKRSYPDKSWLISSYMAKILHDTEEANERTSVDGDELLRRCGYIVMGEEKLVGEVTAHGYELNIDATGHLLDGDRGIITVGDVWQLAENDYTFNLSSIKRVCLSFALFKLLRRRFEHLPPTTADEAHNCRRIMFISFDSLGGSHRAEVAEALFSVMADEVKFLSEYYHSVVPVVLAGPLFVLVNYILVPVVVLILCLIAVALCGRGDLSHGLSSMSAENYALQPGFSQLAICTLARAGYSRPAFFFTLDLSVTLILLIIFFAEEICEFLTVLISNWFIISMLCSYYAKRYSSALVRRGFRWILWLRSKMSKYTNIRLKQFSLLSNYRCGPRLIAALVPGTLHLNVKSVPMTAYLKELIAECLAIHNHSGDARAPLALGHVCRRYFRYYYDLFSWTYSSDSVTEVILTWHIATCLLEVRFPARRGEGMKEAAAAVSLSQYCAYLVVFHPELLPDRRAKTELVHKQAMGELMNLLGVCGYYLSSPVVRAEKLYALSNLIRSEGRAADTDEVVRRGMRLANQLSTRMFFLGDVEALEGSWKVLSAVWTEVLVYAAIPPLERDEELVKGHADILGEGVELITVLWAFAMHNGLKHVHDPGSRDI